MNTNQIVETLSNNGTIEAGSVEIDTLIKAADILESMGLVAAYYDGLIFARSEVLN